MTCITPLAFALDTMPLLQPLSCQPMAAASEGGTPFAAAIWPIALEVVRVAVGYGAAGGTTRGRTATPPAGVSTARAVAGSRLASGEPVGSLSGVPASSGRCGLRPFIHASCETLMPLRAARPESVSPGRTR